MQTHKKRFRKKRNTKRKQYQNKNRILKGLICYKIKVIPRSKRIVGGDGKVDRLESIIKDKEIQNNEDIKPFLKSIDMVFNSDIEVKMSESLLHGVNGKDDVSNVKKKRDKIFNEILTEDITVPSTSMRDSAEDKEKKEKARADAKPVKYLLYYLTTGRPSDELRKKFEKEDLEKKLKDKPSAADVDGLKTKIEALSKELTKISKEIQAHTYTERLYTDEDIKTEKSSE
jgi:hypothetical protein